MYQQNFKAIVNKSGASLFASLDVVFFRENETTVAYCPALDLSAYGNNQKEAKQEFAQSFYEYSSYCIDNDTLEKDLLAHGWTMKDGKLQEPAMDYMIRKNETLRDIVNNKNYRKLTIRVNKKQRPKTAVV
ncbi:MAG: hypothetical protein ACI4BD_06110 [Paludibacteraceae bacterium]